MMYSPVARAHPCIRAFAGPPFSGIRKNRTCGVRAGNSCSRTSRITSMDLSGVQSSMKMNSRSSSVWENNDRAQRATNGSTL